MQVFGMHVWVPTVTLHLPPGQVPSRQFPWTSSPRELPTHPPTYGQAPQTPILSHNFTCRWQGCAKIREILMRKKYGNIETKSTTRHPNYNKNSISLITAKLNLPDCASESYCTLFVGWIYHFLFSLQKFKYKYWRLTYWMNHLPIMQGNWKN